MFLHEQLNPSWIFDNAGYGASSVFFKIDWYFDFKILNIQKAVSNKYGRSILQPAKKSLEILP